MKNAVPAGSDGVISLFAFRLLVTSISHQLCIALKMMLHTSDYRQQISGDSGAKMLIRHPDPAWLASLALGTDPVA